MRLVKTKEENIEENYLELHYDKIDEGIPISDKRRVNTLRALPKAGARI